MANDPQSMEDDAELYRALMDKDGNKVLGLCLKYPEGPLRILTKLKDTVLHLALYSMQVRLVLDLLSDDYLTSSQRGMLNKKNSSENTILHEAATQEKCISAAKRILKLQPWLITVTNKRGETPILRAVRYGKIKMFKFLSRQVQELFQTEDQRRKIFYNTEKGYTMLHAAVYNEHIELAFYIAKKYNYLVGEKNQYGMTALQILATTPSVFTHPNRSSWLKYLIRAFVTIEDEDDSLDEQEGKAILTKDGDGYLDEKKVALSCRVPWWDGIHQECRRYEAAVELAKLLVKEDTTWIHEDTKTLPAKPDDTKTLPPKPPSPLILATMWGCFEIARHILRLHPQTVEHPCQPHGSILHLAIKYRRMKILDVVEKMDMPMRRLIRTKDFNENTVLHVVGEKRTKDDDQSTKKNKEKGAASSDSVEQNASNGTTSYPWDLQEIDNKTRSPAFELQEDLILFERVQKIVKNRYHKTRNKKNQTPEQQFALNKEKLRNEAQEWLKRTAENCSIVAVLIATVAFAAAYTVPGGSNTNGAPVLINQTFFVVFTISDVLSLTFTLTAVIIFLSILTSSFRLQDFKESLLQKLMLGVTCLTFSVSMMMLAFTATIILMINNKERWTKIALYTVAFLPVTVLAVTYLPLYVPLTQTFNYTLKKIWSFFPKFTFQRQDIPSTATSTSTSVSISFDDNTQV